MSSLFITATNTNVGKTYTTIKLIEAFATQGIKVGVYKPIETGVVDFPADANMLLQACQKVNPKFHQLTPYDITAYTFPLAASPFCADIDKTINIQQIVNKYTQLQNYCDLLLIEGAGGLMVPLTDDYFMIDLIPLFKAQTLLVASDTLGSINDTLLSMQALQSRNIAFKWCVNRRTQNDTFEQITKPFYDAYFTQWQTLEALLKDSLFLKSHLHKNKKFML